MSSDPASGSFRIHLLDVGKDQYGDCVLCEIGSTRILIDGSHPGDQKSRNGFPSIPAQLEDLLGEAPPFRLDLLVVTHCHRDHIGCLPALVQAETFTADWALVADEHFGWGEQGPEDDAALPVDSAPRSVVQALAGLREEPPDATDAAALEAFLADAVTMRQRYRTMLHTVADRGTRLVRYGRDSVSDLLAAFDSIGLRILGPSAEHLALCTAQLADLGRDAFARAAELAQADAGRAGADLYRALLRQDTDSSSAFTQGAALNCQSIVLELEAQGRRVLLTGDMQFASPGVRDLDTPMRALRRRIRNRAPYDFVKLAHHAARNAVDAAVLEECQAPYLGISTGLDGDDHPNARVLDLLRETPDITWARTDRNGRITVALAPGSIKVRVSRGTLNDPTPKPPQDASEVGGQNLARESSRAGSEGGPPAPTPGTFVEVTARIPHLATRVVLTVEVAPAAQPPAPAGPDPALRTPSPRPPLRILEGRSQPPKLLFAVGRAGLERNLSPGDLDTILRGLKEAGQDVAFLDAGGKSAPGVAAELQPRLRAAPYDGLVLLGGYDVLPSFAVDVLHEPLRAQVRRADDADSFVVWSDDLYADFDGDGQADLPVSRIPDGRLAEFMFKALSAPPASLARGRAGVRNFHRPFADQISANHLPGKKALKVSEPTRPQDIEVTYLDADAVYLMLHGAHFDGRRFWGATATDPDDLVEAFEVQNLRPCAGAVVLTGCCWGALTVRDLAYNHSPATPFAPRSPEASIALSFLRQGANAFVGCTGSHYSPLEAPYAYFGGPLHTAFWQGVGRGVPPSLALFQAKRAYGAEIPHPRPGDDMPGPGHVAIERKILAQFTCLGLGW